MTSELGSVRLSTSRRLTIAAILGSLSAIGPLSIDMYLPAFPAIAEELETSASLTQLSLTACLIGISLGQLVVGPISDVRGRRIPLLIGIALYTIASLLCFFVPNIATFVFIRFIQGFSGAAGIVISRASARDLFSGRELIKFFSLLMLINGAAPILAPVIGGVILQYTSWRGVFAVLSILGLLMLLGIYTLLKETLPVERRSKGGLTNTLQTFGSLLRDSKFMGFILTQGFVMAAMFAYISGSSFVLQGIYELNSQQYSYIFGLNGLGIVVAAQIAGRISSRIAAPVILKTGLFVNISGASLLFIAVVAKLPLWLVLLGLFLVVSSVGIVSTMTTSLALQDQGNRAGSASALLGMIGFIFGGLVAPLVGLGGEGTALPMVITILAMSCLAMTFYLVLTRRMISST